ncbi:solute carrier family 26 [Seminavis robusta]|uniref:Solute carrier family 26 n=1 Tax=Seminavis robusta TaxID=568900 RepID=A0A9N8DMS9_9STRA|nr:solute carrier family 26 [Seminavis robusta]|eukprot:Sro231_g093510.1 solute carrier family 26 (1237) ;mRNA; f:2960-6915
MTTPGGKGGGKPEAASSLMGMFEPPPGAATTTDNAKETSKAKAPTSTSPTTGTSKSGPSTTTAVSPASKGSPSAASPQAPALLGMFEPPTPTAGNQASPSAMAPTTGTTKPTEASLMSMFEPPTPARVTSVGQPQQQQQQQPSPLSPESFALHANQRTSLTATVRHANSQENGTNLHTENSTLLQSIFDQEETPKVHAKNMIDYNAVSDNNNQFDSLLVGPSSSNNHHQSEMHFVRVKDSTDEEMQKFLSNVNKADAANNNNNKQSWKEFLAYQFQPSTFAGAFMFLLYHVVFCLANGSAIIRPHANKPIFGEMAKLSVVGIFAAAPLYIARLGNDVPAVYPSLDLFMAPFLASAAVTVDQSLADDGITGEDTNDVFFATFAVLAALGMGLSGILLWLAAKFKLASLGTFLPYSVLCGFFSAVGVLMWALAFSVDTTGKTWQYVFFSGDTDLILTSLMHHIPSLMVGILMNLLGPKHPFYVIFLISLTILGFYTTMWITGTTLEEAQQNQWFWSQEELSIQASDSDEGFLASWAPPLPFGHFGSMLEGQVNYKAVYAGLKDMFAMAFCYLLRSSIHASAMKKNVGNLVCKKRVKKKKSSESEEATTASKPKKRGHKKDPSYAQATMEALTDNVRMINESLADTRNASGTHSVRFARPSKLSTGPGPKLQQAPTKVDNSNDEQEIAQEYEYIEIRPKPCRRTLQDIFAEYGYALMAVGLSGGFGVCPVVATSNTMYALGAGHSSPQYLSVLLLIIFYVTDFELVRYIPKACFSALLVLGAVDTFVVWFFLSYRKTQDLMEWLVVPFIVAFSLVVGFLNAVFLGVGISTFVFVAAFFRVGVVKFNATGLEIRSTIERSQTISKWLDTHGDYIQVLVLQNFLFFGNASSILNYISTMFEEDYDGSVVSSFDLPPVPKVLIIDMSLNTGMDTSTLDIFAEITELCKTNNCKVFLCGLSSRAKKGLGLTGVKPDTSIAKDERLVRFFSDLDTALGKAEDLISLGMIEKKDDTYIARSLRLPRSGFQTALKHIDEQHGQEFSKALLELEQFAVALELQPGEPLFASDGGRIEDSERGLVFVESGQLRIEKDANETLTRGHSITTRNRSFGTFNNLHARSGTLGRQRAALKASTREPMTRTFRLARIGPGWVVGNVERASGLKHGGVCSAVTYCQLHHLSFQKLEMLERENPRLILALYKMLSHLMVRRQEITIEQLATFHSIMSAPAHSKPLSRTAMMALRR